MNVPNGQHILLVLPLIVCIALAVKATPAGRGLSWAHYAVVLLAVLVALLASRDPAIAALVR